MPSRSSQACVSGPRVPSASTVTVAEMSMGGWYPAAGAPSRPRPAGVVRTPATRVPSTSRESTGKPGKMFTPSSSARSPSQRTISQIEPTKLP